MEKGSGTRSGLLWEVERILDECEELPQILLMENVPQVVGTKNKEHFDKWVSKLEELGYSNYWEILNAKDYGIPQNRKRCFMVSILGNGTYQFPKPFELKLRLKDMLEDEVDEKYYLSEKQIISLESGKYNSSRPSEKIKRTNTGVCPTIDTMQGGNRQPFIAIKNANKKGYEDAFVGDSVNLCYPNSKTRRGRVGKQVSQTLTCNDNIGVVVNGRTEN